MKFLHVLIPSGNFWLFQMSFQEIDGNLTSLKVKLPLKFKRGISGMYFGVLMDIGFYSV